MSGMFWYMYHIYPFLVWILALIPDFRVELYGLRFNSEDSDVVECLRRVLFCPPQFRV